MWEREKHVKIVMRRLMVVGNTSFQVPFNTVHYQGCLYYSVNDAANERDAIRQFEEMCRKENVFIGKDVEYDLRSENMELYVSGHFLFFAETDKDVDEICERNGICFGEMQEISSGLVFTREQEEE